jgi:hypothetical protein
MVDANMSVQHPMMLSQDDHNQAFIGHLFANPHMKHIAGFGSSEFATHIF